MITLCRKCHSAEDLKLWNGNWFKKGVYREEKERNSEILSLVGKKSLTEIGKMFGITRQRVHQLVNK